MEKSRSHEGREREGKVVLEYPQQQQQLECFSDEVDSGRDGAGEKKDTRGGTPVASWSTATEASAKRRRGRPPGSKNKPKPPVVVMVTREAEPAGAMRPHVLEIPGGGDVAGTLAGFARRCGLGICVLSCTGAVANVSLRNPSHHSAQSGAAAGAVVVFHGRYDILSISATFLPPAAMSSSAVPPHAFGGLSISFTGPNGQIFGGTVAGPLVAATTVVVVAVAFANPTFHRLPAVEDDASASVSASGEAADEHRGHQPDTQEHHHATTTRLQPHPHYSMAPATQPVP